MGFETSSQFIDELKEKFQANILATRESVSKKVYVEIHREAIRSIAQHLFRGLGARFNTIIGVDRRPTHQDFQTTHIFSLDEDKIFVLLQASLDRNRPEMDSI